MVSASKYEARGAPAQQPPVSCCASPFVPQLSCWCELRTVFWIAGTVNVTTRVPPTSSKPSSRTHSAGKVAMSHAKNACFRSRRWCATRSRCWPTLDGRPDIQSRLTPSILYRSHMGALHPALLLCWPPPGKPYDNSPQDPIALLSSSDGMTGQRSPVLHHRVQGTQTRCRRHRFVRPPQSGERAQWLPRSCQSPLQSPR